MSIKENIRNEKRYERSLLSEAHIARLSDNFLSQWIKFSKELSYQSIGIYYPFDNEASTFEIMKYLHSKNKDVLLPVIENDLKKEKLIKLVSDSGLRGLGGAGFPAGKKWSFVSSYEGPRLMTVNGDEGEPGTCKDRDILRFEPHKIIEGCLVASYAIQAHKSFFPR